MGGDDYEGDGYETSDSGIDTGDVGDTGIDTGDSGIETGDIEDAGIDTGEVEDTEIDTGDDENIESGNESIDKSDNVEHISSRNESLEGQNHPETGVPFERQEIEYEGKKYDVVAPKFESTYDAQLPENELQSSDYSQFKECNSQLRDAVESDEELRSKFDEEQLEQIGDGETPDGYTWHHDVQVGKMQLVDTEIHQKTAHTGGRNIWGGGTDKR